MKKNIVFLVILSTVVFTSCNLSGKKEAERLKAQNDSLVQVQSKMQDEVNSYFSAMNDIQDNIDKIKSAQNDISVQPLSENTPEDVKQKVREDMDYLNNLIKTNQDEISKLRSKLKNSGYKLTNVEKALTNLSKALDEQKAKVASLTMQLQQKDSVISHLNNTVTDLGKNVDELTTTSNEQKEKITQQEKAINTAWYAIGTLKELKENKIVSTSGLFSSKKVMQSTYNKNYFVKIDARNTKQIPLYTSAKAKILTSHPTSSYMFEKDNGNYVLIITDPDAFWSVSKYLVIEVK